MCLRISNMKINTALLTLAALAVSTKAQDICASGLPIADGVCSNGGEIPGRAGVDYPVYGQVPSTNFHCDRIGVPGYYADQESGCQAFYICGRQGKGTGFLCPNGTLFNQEVLVCDWWTHVDCNQAVNYYGINQQILAEMDAANERLGVNQRERERLAAAGINPINNPFDVRNSNNQPLSSRNPAYAPFSPNPFPFDSRNPSGQFPNFGQNRGQFGENNPPINRFGPNPNTRFPNFGPNREQIGNNINRFGPNSPFPNLGPNRGQLAENNTPFNRFGPNPDTRFPNFGPNRSQLGDNNTPFNRFGPNPQFPNFGQNRGQFGENNTPINRFGPNPDTRFPNFGPNREQIGDNINQFGPNPQFPNLGPNRGQLGDNNAPFNRFGPTPDPRFPETAPQLPFGPNAGPPRAPFNPQQFSNPPTANSQLPNNQFNETFGFPNNPFTPFGPGGFPDSQLPVIVQPNGPAPHGNGQNVGSTINPNLGVVSATDRPTAITPTSNTVQSSTPAGYDYPKPIPSFNQPDRQYLPPF